MNAIEKLDAELKKPAKNISRHAKGRIIQCRGYANNTVLRGGSIKPEIIREFEREYQEYLDTVFEKERKTA